MQAGFEGIELLEEREQLVPHAGRGRVPILSRDAESRRQRGGSTQKQGTHEAVSSCLVGLISLTQ
jgi:hypothetical protein